MDLLSKEKELTDFFKTQQHIQSVYLITQKGTISTFLTKKNINESEKNRIAASMLASYALANRSISTLIQENVKNVVIKGDLSNVVVFMMNNGNFLAFITDPVFDIQKEMPKISKIL